MTFWSDPALEPKRTYRFLVSIPGQGGRRGPAIQNYIVKSATKPKFSISETEHNFLNHKFKYPAKVTWEDVTIVITDAVEPNGTNALMAILNASGYRAPVGPSVSAGSEQAQTVSKRKAVAALGKVIIRQIDADGLTVESWELHNAWVKSGEFGDLDYDSEDPLNVTMVISYDWARIDARDLPTYPSNVTDQGKNLDSPGS